MQRNQKDHRLQENYFVQVFSMQQHYGYYYNYLLIVLSFLSLTNTPTETNPCY